jgi:hypothetical protein
MPVGASRHGCSTPSNSGIILSGQPRRSRFMQDFFCGCLNRSGVHHTILLGPIKKGIVSWRFISVLPAPGLFWLPEP